VTEAHFIGLGNFSKIQSFFAKRQKRPRKTRVDFDRGFCAIAMATHGNLGWLQELPPKQVEIFAKSFEFLPNFLTSSLKQLCTENGFPNMRWMARVNEVIEVNKVNEVNEVLT